MKKKLVLSLLFISTFAFYSCVHFKDKWDDNFHLSNRTALFNASGDSAIKDLQHTNTQPLDTELAL